MDEETGDEILADLLEAQLLHFESSDEGSHSGFEKGTSSDLSTITAAEELSKKIRVGVKRERSDPPDDEGESLQENVQVNSRHLRPRLHLSDLADHTDAPGMAPVYSGTLGKLPTQLYNLVLKYLSAEDLAVCSRTCRYLRIFASEDTLWRRSFCLRWGASKSGPQGVGWKQYYFDKDRGEMMEFVRNTPDEFRDLFVQMQAIKRSQVPLPHQVNDHLLVVEGTVAEELSSWRRANGLPDVYSGSHVCDGSVCLFHRLGDVYVCEQTGRAHVCDEHCGETSIDPENQLLVCRISGHCFTAWVSGAEKDQAVAAGSLEDAEPEPVLGNARLGQAYLLGYNCDDEEELQAAQRFLGHC